jgi:hypothetical protein
METEDFLDAEEIFREAMREFINACMEYKGIDSIEDKVIDICEQEMDNV